MVRVLILLLLLISISLSEELEKIKEFFERKGIVVEVLNGKVIIDLGRGRVFEGEEFSVFSEGRKIVHPVTGEVLGYIEEEKGRIKITDVRERFSVGEILEDKGIEKGLKVKLIAKDVCFEGSEENFFRISSIIKNLKEGNNCTYVIKEFGGGFGITFTGKAVAFIEKEREGKEIVFKEGEEEKELKFSLETQFILSFPDLPISADICNFFGDNREFITVLFPDVLKIYEFINDELIEFATMYLPAGRPISVQCAKLEGEKDLILLNMISTKDANSHILRVIGDTIVTEVKNIPYIMAVLDKGDVKNSFVGQLFEEGEFKEVKRLTFEGSSVSEAGDFSVPSGFRIDSAIKVKDVLIFVDEEGYLRVFKNNKLLLSEKDFSGSYTIAEIEEDYEGTTKIIINPRPFIVKLHGRLYVGVIKNITNPIYRFLNVAKFSEGEIYLLLIDNEDAKLKKVKSRKFEETIQSVVPLNDNTVLIFTGRTGTLAVQKGDLYKGVFE